MITVDDERGLDFEHRSIPPNGIVYPKYLRVPAQIFSVFFHPLFIPVYATAYLLFVDHYFFTGFDRHEKIYVLVRVAINMVIFPAITVLLLRGVGFIKSIFLQTQRERIVPYIACGIFFFWMYLVFRNDVMMPKIMVAFTFAVFIASSVALIANIYYKISMHAIGAGGIIGLFISILFSAPEASIPFTMIIGIFIAGIICTSRLIVSNHSQKEIYMGLFVGFACQVLSAAAML